MKRVLGAVLLLCVGCVPMQEETRIERGPLLRTFERQVPQDNKTVQAHVTAKWPSVELSFARYDTCRTEKVDEYADDYVTERTSRGVGPALTLGICGTLAGGGVLLARNAFSNEPNREVIDSSGHYGPAPRQIATGWGTGAVIVGIPALVVAAIDMVRSGESSETVTAQTIVSSRLGLCQREPVNGTVEMLGAHAPMSFPTKDTAITLQAEQFKDLGDLTMNLNGEPVFLAREEDDRLNAFRACTQALPVPENVGELGAGPLHTRLELLQACARVAPEAAEQGSKTYAEALAKMETAARPVGAMPGPRVEGWDEVVTQDAPNRRIAEGTADTLAMLRGELSAGEPVTLLGRVRTRSLARFALMQKGNDVSLVLLRGRSPEEEAPIRNAAVDVREYEVAIVTVGNNDFAVLLTPGAVWDAGVRGGAVMEFEGPVWKATEVDGTNLPTIEAHWARSATLQ